MRLKAFTAKDMPAAMTLVRQDMGPDAVILGVERSEAGNVVVRAAVDRPASPPPPRENFPAPAPRTHDTASPAPSVTAACLAVLAFHGTPPALAQELADAAGRFDRDEPAAGLASALDARFAFQPLPTAPERPLLLVGPPGAGKTSAAAKLAARAILSGAPCDLVCADTERAAGPAQIRAYGDIMGAGAFEASSPDALARLVRNREEGRPMFIDAPATNPFDFEDLEALAELVRASGAEPIAVLDAGSQPADASDAAGLFASIGCRRMVLAKCDVARRLGALVAAPAGGLALAALSASPYIGGGVTPASPLRLARLLMAAQPEPDEVHANVELKA